MAIFQFLTGAKGQTDSMAAQKTVAEANAKVASGYFELLLQTGTNREAFEQVVARMQEDRSVGPLEAALVARNFGVSGKKLGSKSAALAAIKKRFVELVRFHKKNRVAANTRPW